MSSGEDRALLESGRGRAEHLLALQRLAPQSLIVSVTRRCPARCAHCIVSSGPDVGGDVLSPDTALLWAGELPKLAAQGLRHITFTGGEPVLGLPAIRILSEVAASSGIATAVVTSAAWATSAEAAASVVRKLSSVSHWDLGYDEYHARHIPFERLRQAVEALRKQGAAFSVRVCTGDPPLPPEARLLEAIRGLVGPSVLMIRQSVRRIGRAQELEGNDVSSFFPSEPCLSTGPYVREDGSVGPCCSGLAYEARGRHSFTFGNAIDEGLAECRQRWLQDPLLRLLRLVGFATPLRWLLEEGLAEAFSAEIPRTACELCVSLWDPEGKVARFLEERASRPEVVSQLDRLEAHLFA